MPRHIYKQEYFIWYASRGKKTQDCRMPGCDKTMDWDKSEITEHFKKNHPGTNLKSYYEEYVRKVIRGNNQ